MTIGHAKSGPVGIGKRVICMGFLVGAIVACILICAIRWGGWTEHHPAATGPAVNLKPPVSEGLTDPPQHDSPNEQSYPADEGEQVQRTATADRVSPASAAAPFEEHTNGLVKLTIARNGLLRVSIPRKSSGYYCLDGPSPLNRNIDGTGVPAGVFIKARRSTGEIITNNMMIENGWYTPLIYASSGSINTGGKKNLIPACGDSGLVEITRLLIFLDRSKATVPDLSGLEFKILVKTSALGLYTLNGEPVTDATLNDIETAWIKGDSLILHK